jgi:hypothetical protein
MRGDRSCRSCPKDTNKGMNIDEALRGEAPKQKQIEIKLVEYIMTSLIDLLTKYTDDAVIVKHISAIMIKPNEYRNHCNFRVFMLRAKKTDCPLWRAYYDEFDEYMYILDGNDKYWKNDKGQYHRTKKNEKGDETLPAIEFCNGNRKWYENGSLHRTDRDQHGNTLPADIRIGRCTFWNYMGNCHRAEIGKNPLDAHFGKPLPAIIYNNGACFWKFHNKEVSQSKIAEYLEVIPLGSRQNLKDLKTKYPDAKLIIKQIIEANCYASHFLLRKFMNPYTNDPLFAAYYDEFNEFMFDDDANGDRTWKKIGNSFTYHRTKTFTNPETGLIETYPAIINNSEKTWWINGQIGRIDKDQYGNLLPAVVNSKKQKWRANSQRHRSEICNDPNSKHFNKALPAVIYNDGREKFYYEDKVITQDELTKKVNEKNGIHIFTNVKYYEVVFANGDKHLVRQPILSMHIVQSLRD